MFYFLFSQRGYRSSISLFLCGSSVAFGIECSLSILGCGSSCILCKFEFWQIYLSVCL